MPVFHQRTAYLRWLAKRRRGPQGDPGGEGDQGDPGADSTVPGPPGAAATISVGTVSTLSAGSSATVANVGTPAAAVLNFGIPIGPGLKTFRATGTTDASGNVTFSMSAASFAAAPVVAASLQASVTGATDVRVTALTATSCTVNVRQAAGISVALLGLTLLGVPAALPGVTVHILAAPAGAQA